jgi:hypothetical protein
VGDLEPRKRRRRDVVPAALPSVVVPIPLGDARGFVHDALHGTSIADPFANFLSGWMFFEPRVRYTAEDASHTRIELDLAATRPGANALLYPQRRAEIDRFFVALDDELDRRERWRPRPALEGAPGSEASED